MVSGSSGGKGIFGITFGLPYKNVNPFIADIIHSRLATLHELRTVYDLEDACNLHEVDYVPAYNNYLRRKREADKAERKRLVKR